MSTNIEANMFCKKCGTRLSKENLFCHNCGAKVQHDAVTEEKEEIINVECDEKRPSAKNKKPPKFVLERIKKSLILAMAILMIIAALLPVVRYKFSYFDDDNDEVTIKFTAIDGIQMLVNSWGSLDEGDIRDEMDELAEEAEEYMEDWEDGDELGELSSYLKKLLKLSLRSDAVNTPWELVFIGVFSVAQILLSIVLLALSALSFATVFSDKIRDFSKAALAILGINAVLLAANGFAYGLFICEASDPVRLAPIQICVLVFAALVFLTFAFARIFVNKNLIGVGEIIKRSLGVVFAVVLLLSCLAPVVSTEVKVQFANHDEEKRVTTQIDPSLFGAFSLDEVTKESLEDMSEKRIDSSIRSSYSTFETYTKRDFKRGEANTLNKSIFAGLLLNYGAYSVCGIFAGGSAALILVFFCAMLLIFKNLYELAFGERLSSVISISAKALAIVMSVITLTLIIVACTIVRINVESIDIVYKARVAYGPILMLISAITTACIPDAFGKKRLDKETVNFNE